MAPDGATNIAVMAMAIAINRHCGKSIAR